MFLELTFTSIILWLSSHPQQIFKAKTVGNCLVSPWDATEISYGECLMLQFRSSWNLVSFCVFRRHGQRSNVLAVFISLSGSEIRPCFALLFFTIKFNFKFKVHAKYIVMKI